MRARAHQDAWVAREKAEIEGMHARNLARAESVELDADGRPRVYAMVGDKKVTEPLGPYLARITKIRDDNRAKLEAQRQKEAAADAIITRKLAAIVELDRIEEEWQLKIESGTLTPEAAASLWQRIEAMLLPLIGKKE
jgi:hypothetical protein